MTLSYRSPHQIVVPHDGDALNPVTFTAVLPPVLPPGPARGAEWLMAHVVDVIAAGPIYDGKLSPVWAQMVRLYAQYLGILPKRAPAAPSSDPARAGRRQMLEQDLRALIPVIADMIERQETADEETAGEEADDEGDEESDAPQPLASCSPAEGEAYELAPLLRLDDAGAMRAALGFRPRPETLHRVLKLALDASLQRARALRGAEADLSPAAFGLADRLRRKWTGWFFGACAEEPVDEADGERQPDFFESVQQTARRRRFPPDGKPPN